MKKRNCQLCSGWGTRSGWFKGELRVEECRGCSGEGKIDWPTEWRPHEPGKENDGSRLCE